MCSNGIFNPRMATLLIETIASLDTPELSIYRTLRRPEEHERAGVLVASNIKVVQRLLVSRFPVISVLLTPEWFQRLEPKLRALPEDLRVYVGEKALLESITGYQLHQGALAVARIPPQPSFDALLKTLSSEAPERYALKRSGCRLSTEISMWCSTDASFLMKASPLITVPFVVILR